MTNEDIIRAYKLISDTKCQKDELAKILSKTQNEVEKRHFRRLSCSLQTILEQFEYHLEQVEKRKF